MLSVWTIKRRESGYGCLNYEGKYIPRDYSNAVKWYRRLANNTRVPFVIRADAMVKLGTMFLKGEANQSNDAAYHWYERFTSYFYCVFTHLF